MKRVFGASSMNQWKSGYFAFLIFVMMGSSVFAEPAVRLTLNAAVELALQNYPAISAAQAKVKSANAGIDLAHTQYIPKLDLLWQENRATRNNVFGLLLPQPVVPSISGPVVTTNSGANAWGDAEGVLFSWEPFDFGLRHANVEVARSLKNQANATLNTTKLDVASAAADTFLDVLSADQAVRAAESNLERRKVFNKSVHVLVDNQLRPGADASRADAEVAAATIQLIQTQEGAETTRARLAEALGIPGTAVNIEPGPLLDSSREVAMFAPHPEAHPLSIAQEASIKAVQDREAALDRSYVPRFNMQFVYFGRGTGNLTDGTVNAQGLLPQVSNWAVGLTVNFPLLQSFEINARRNQEVGNEVAEKARYAQIIQHLQAEYISARVLVDGALRIVENTPVELSAAKEVESRARARYQAGLASVTEVAEAQQLLAQAEVDHAVARLNVWRAELLLARVEGNLDPFLQLVAAAKEP